MQSVGDQFLLPSALTALGWSLSDTESFRSGGSECSNNVCFIHLVSVHRLQTIHFHEGTSVIPEIDWDQPGTTTCLHSPTQSPLSRTTTDSFRSMCSRLFSFSSCLWRQVSCRNLLNSSFNSGWGFRSDNILNFVIFAI